MDLPVSVGDGTVTSSHQEPMRVVTLKLEDCHEMLGPNGVYKVPTEDCNPDDKGSCSYDEHDGDGDYDDDDDDDSGDSNEGDSDYDPTSE